jgi:hypothetical protein
MTAAPKVSSTVSNTGTARPVARLRYRLSVPTGMGTGLNTRSAHRAKRRSSPAVVTTQEANLIDLLLVFMAKWGSNEYSPARSRPWSSLGNARHDSFGDA